MRHPRLRPGGTAWIGRWPQNEKTGYFNPRCYELLRRWSSVHQVKLPSVKGISRVEPVVTRLLSPVYSELISWNPHQIKHWRGPVIADIDDPTFSQAEIACLNAPNVRLVVTTTERLRERFQSSGVTKQIDVVPSGFSRRDLGSPQKDELAKAHNPNRRPVVGYVGANLALDPDGLDQGDVSWLVWGMEKVWAKQPDIQLWLIGKTTPEVTAWAGKHPSAKLFGSVRREELLAHIENFTLATYPRRLDHGGRFSVKLIEYMGAGVPVVASEVAETTIVEEAGAGLRSDNREDFATSLLSVLESPSYRAALSRNASSFARAFDWDLIADEYEKRILSP